VFACILHAFFFAVYATIWYIYSAVNLIIFKYTKSFCYCYSARPVLV